MSFLDISSVRPSLSIRRTVSTGRNQLFDIIYSIRQLAMPQDLRNLDLTSRTLRVNCTYYDTVFHIHEILLRNASNSLKFLVEHRIGYDGNPDYDIKVDAPVEGFEVLARWLYTGQIEDADEDIESGETEQDHVVKLCKAYKAGTRLSIGSAFLDALMDKIIDIMTDEDGDGDILNEKFQVDQILPDMLAAFPAGSPTRKFAVDWLVHMELNVDDEAMSDEDALRYVREDEDFCQMLGAEFLAQKVGNSEEPGWKFESCPYHVHHLHGQNCYRADEEAR